MDRSLQKSEDLLKDFYRKPSNTSRLYKVSPPREKRVDFFGRKTFQRTAIDGRIIIFCEPFELP